MTRPGNNSNNGSGGGGEPSLKLRTARTLKWNTIDRLSSQVMYAITGIVLANILPREDFGLVGALMVFQAFAIVFVDSGFGAALLQKKTPDERDYSTVFWFNLSMSVLIYVVLWLCAPGIADIFQGDKRLIPLSRVMFISFIINGLGIVQTNRLMKRMDVRQIAVSNVAGLLISGVTGIWIALTGGGAWALVWQTVVLAVVKTSWLWISEKWIPMAVFSLQSLRQIFRVGMGVFTSSILNTLFLHIYSFVIGAWYSMTSLGDYTQADKWSKMGSASLSQILTASFVPVLAGFQDNAEKFRTLMKRINSLTAFMLFPTMGLAAALASPLFHTLFGHKWDAAIILFQILIVRGVFTVLVSLYNNYILALGHARSIVVVEIVKDVVTIGAIALTMSAKSLEALVWGQLCAGVVTYIFVLCLTTRLTAYKSLRFLTDMVPYAALSAAAMAAAYGCTMLPTHAWLQLAVGLIVGGGIYIGVLHFTDNAVFGEARRYLFGRFVRKKISTDNQQQ